jgi:hypothetical protein
MRFPERNYHSTARAREDRRAFLGILAGGLSVLGSLEVSAERSSPLSMSTGDAASSTAA